MKKNYVTFKLDILLFAFDDIVTASVSDGVNVEWIDDWNTGLWEN